MTVKLIAHTLIEKRQEVSAYQTLENKASLPNVYPSYWDSGGSVEENRIA